MQIKELIKKLKTYPEDMLVVVEGYEEGYDDIESIRTIQTDLYANRDKDSFKKVWWEGIHGETEKGTLVLLLSRNLFEEKEK